MKLKTLLKLLQELPKEALEGEVVHIPDDTDCIIRSVEYGKEENVIYLSDKTEN